MKLDFGRIYSLSTFIITVGYPLSYVPLSYIFCNITEQIPLSYRILVDFFCNITEHGVSSGKLLRLILLCSFGVSGIFSFSSQF